MSPSGKKISKTIIKRYFKKYWFTNTLDGAESDTVWEIVYTGNLSLKIDTEDLDCE